MPAPMLNATLIKMEMGQECFDIYPYSRNSKQSRCFCFARDRFTKWLIQEDNSTFYDKHIYSTLEANKRDGDIRFRIMRADIVSNDEFHGHFENFSIPVEVMREFLVLTDGEKMRYLYVPRVKPMKIVTSNVRDTIRKIADNKLAKRAFIKAISSWNWHGDTITLYRDFVPLSFYFRSDSWPREGGLILHESKKKTRAGELPCYAYSVHT